MAGTLFDDLFASGARPIHDAVFGSAWNILPQAKPSSNAPSAADPSRPVIEGIVAIFTDRTELFKATHVYDAQADKRPGLVTAEFTLEMPDAFDGVPIDLRADDIGIRLFDGSQWRINTPRRDGVTNRLICSLGRLS